VPELDLVEVSELNCTPNGAIPEYELAVKLALGLETLTYVVCVDRFDQILSVTFSLIE
jgi:hypothetical protein